MKTSSSREASQGFKEAGPAIETERQLREAGQPREELPAPGKNCLLQGRIACSREELPAPGKNCLLQGRGCSRKAGPVPANQGSSWEAGLFSGRRVASSKSGPAPVKHCQPQESRASSREAGPAPKKQGQLQRSRSSSRKARPAPGMEGQLQGHRVSSGKQGSSR
jgi:hypothetical protein